jgi:ribosomal protein L11 methyltransferase
MHALILQCSAEDKDRIVADLWERGTAGVIEQEIDDRVELQAFFNEPFAVDTAACSPARWEAVEDVNWARVTMESWEPILVGERFFVVPAWRSDPTPPGRLRLETHPGLALGTGYHPTTQMCLEAMERLLQPGSTFFDLGTGSGILSQAAALLGAGKIVTCDNDSQAVEAAAENLDRAGVRALLFRGSMDAVQPKVCEFLVANISPATVIELARPIAQALAAGGVAVLSGFEPNEIRRVRHEISTEPFKVVEEVSRDDWASIIAVRT